MSGDPLRHLLDLEQLRALGQRYARAADDRDYDAMADLFHPDAVVDGLRGESPIAEYLDAARSTPPSFETSMHVLGDPVIALEPGADEATLDAYAVVYQVNAHVGGGNMTLGMQYLDRCERRDGVWRIRHRATRMRWAAT